MHACNLISALPPGLLLNSHTQTHAHTRTQTHTHTHTRTPQKSRRIPACIRIHSPRAQYRWVGLSRCPRCCLPLPRLGVVYVTCVGLFVGFAGTYNDPTLPGGTAVLVGQGHTRDLTHAPLLRICPLDAQSLEQTSVQQLRVSFYASGMPFCGMLLF
jgi:hypothetical protein